MPSDHYIGRWEKYFLLHVLVYSVAENFYELCRILTSPQVESKNKKTSWILGIRYQDLMYLENLESLSLLPSLSILVCLIEVERSFIYLHVRLLQLFVSTGG